MSFRDKWLVLLGALFAGLSLAVLLTYWLLLPALVERSLRDALRQRGLGEVTFSLDSMSLSGLKLRDLSLDRARTLTVKQIEVDYSLADLMAGRVDEVRLIDARYHLEVSRDYAIDWGPGAKLLAGAAIAGPPPLSQVRWLQSQLVIQTPSRTIAVPVSGSATFADEETQLNIRGELFNEELEVHASTHSQWRAGLLRGSLRAPATGQAPRDSITASVRFTDLRGTPRAEIELQGQRRSLRVVAGERDWALANAVVNLHLQLEGEEVMGARGAFSASAVSAGEISVLKPRLSIKRAAADLELEITAQVEECRLTLRGPLSPRPSEWDASGPFHSDWQLQGALPSSLANALADAGIRASHPQIELARGHAVVTRTRNGWQGQIHDGSATLAAKALTMQGPQFLSRAVKAQIRFGASFDALGGELALRKESEMTAQSLRWKTLAIRRARRASPALRVRLDDDATFRWNRDPPQWRVGKARAMLRANIRYGDAINVRNARGTLVMTSRPDPSSPVASRPDPSSPVASRPDPSSPVASRPDPRILWSTLRAESLEVGPVTVPAVSARIRGRPTRLQIRASARLTKAANLSVRATLRGRGKRQRCPIALELPRARIERGDRLATLIQKLVPVQISGSVALQAQVDPCGTASDIAGELTLAAVRATHASGTLVGVHGTLHFLGLKPIRTKGWQTFRWSHSNLGERKLGPGSLVFRSQAPGVFAVQEATLDLRGGTIQTSAFVVDPEQLEIETTLFANKLQVKKWLPIVSRGRASGTGTLSGQFGIRLRWTPKLHLNLFRGHLSSDGGGRFYFLDRAWLLQALRRYSAGFGQGGSKSDLIKDRILGALMDFNYSSVALRIQGDDPPVLQVTTRGTGRRIPQELDLTINIRGFEEAINPALRAWLANEEQQGKP